MLKQLQVLILEKQKLLNNKQPVRFRYYKIRKLDKKMDKIAKAYAKACANDMYKKSYELCRSIIEANFQ